MIKIGILGAETAAAGELIRILINHPDVVLTTVASSQLPAGTRVDEAHRGLTGDTDLTISPALHPAGHSAVFLCGEPWMAREWMETYNKEAEEMELRIIDLTGAFRKENRFGMVYGLPEHNRKALVRGATRASLPSAVAMAVELALFPLAKDMLLPSGAHITATVELPDTPAMSAAADALSAPANLLVSTRLDPIAPIDHRPDPEAYAAEIAAALREMQPSVKPLLSVRLTRRSGRTRGITARVSVPLSHSLADLNQRYADAYADHNFTYVVNRRLEVEDIDNTNKCLLHLEYPATGSSELEVTAVMDALLKGSAGNAVHCMNLLFGLSERTGLALKASVI